MKTLYNGGKWFLIFGLLAFGGLYTILKAAEKSGFEAVAYGVVGIFALAIATTVLYFIGEGMSEWEDKHGPPIRPD